MPYLLQYALKWIGQWMVPTGIAVLEQLLGLPQPLEALQQSLKRHQEE
jgi:hypothetical protein